MRICTFTYKSIGASDDFEPLWADFLSDRTGWCEAIDRKLIGVGGVYAAR